jgi:hypothetical protein
MIFLGRLKVESLTLKKLENLRFENYMDQKAFVRENLMLIPTKNSVFAVYIIRVSSINIEFIENVMYMMSLKTYHGHYNGHHLK